MEKGACGGKVVTCTKSIRAITSRDNHHIDCCYYCYCSQAIDDFNAKKKRKGGAIDNQEEERSSF